MAVPTIYVRLIAAWEEADPERGGRLSRGGRTAAADGLGLGGAAGPGARALAGDHRPRAARALRHDRDRHGAVEPARRRAPRRARSAARCPGSRCGWSTRPAARWPTAPPGRSRCGARPSSASTGAGPRPPARASATAGSSPATWRSSRRASTASSAAGASTSSSAAATRSRRSRSRRCSPATRRSASARCVGVDDPEWGQRVAAAVVLEGGAEPRPRGAARLGQGTPGDLQGAEPSPPPRRAAAQRHGQGHQTGNRRADRRGAEGRNQRRRDACSGFRSPPPTNRPMNHDSRLTSRAPRIAQPQPPTTKPGTTAAARAKAAPLTTR